MTDGPWIERADWPSCGLLGPFSSDRIVTVRWADGFVWTERASAFPWSVESIDGTPSHTVVAAVQGPIT